MEGAAIRLERDREMVWFGAMLPHMDKPVKLDDFIGRKKTPKTEVERVKSFWGEWDRIERALARG